ncbi:hypothetical protein CSW41_01655 [Thermus scotoductus]|uniref:Uncharacterized protein n=1 Tax=Thermus scotoductus TaxID=37636 RepID=A0A430RP54_THESC|nr:hypothetical protein CSW41_01655 [Thermus scotoductus]
MPFILPLPVDRRKALPLSMALVARLLVVDDDPRISRVQDPRLASHLEAYLEEKRLPLEGNGLLEELAQALYA